jgi:hypothetical protein
LLVLTANPCGVLLIGLLCVFVIVACAMIAWASPADGVTPTLIGRGSYEPFKVNTEPTSPVDFEAKAKSHVDIVVRTHDYAAVSSTGGPSSTG